MSFTDIFSAAKEGAIEDVKYFIEEKGVHANVKDDDDDTPLHYAARYNPNVEVLKYLVSQGADVNATDKDGYTPLHCAAFSGDVETAKILVSAGADVNAEDKNGRTPLQHATFHGHVEVAEFLVSAGANVNAQGVRTMKLKNKIIPNGPYGNGPGQHILSGKPTDNPRVSVYLLSNIEKKNDYSLWNIEISEDEASFKMWSYEGDDYEDLKYQLLDDYIETAFD
jgi:ankyrin repeat protein